MIKGCDGIKERNFIYVNDYIDEYTREELLDKCNMLKNDGVDSKLIKIRMQCGVCGCEVIATPGLLRKQKGFKCELHISKRPSGKDSKFYNRVETQCTNCNKVLEVTPYELNKKNKFGDSHNFCTPECYWEYRSKYYVKEKGAMYNYQRTPEQLQRMREATARSAIKQNRLDTEIQLKVNSILDSLRIAFEREKQFKYNAYDNYLSEYNLLIEVMGDYWHGSPLRYGRDKYLLNKYQQRQILKDKQKRGYMRNHDNIPVLYLWETDINKEPRKCKELIKYFTHHNKDMIDYNSFNYKLVDNKLKLNDNLITPYQDMKSKEYLHLVKSD